MKKSFREGLNSSVDRKLKQISEEYEKSIFDQLNELGELDLDTEDDELTEAKEEEIINGQKVDYINGKRYVQMFDFG